MRINAPRDADVAAAAVATALAVWAGTAAGRLAVAGLALLWVLWPRRQKPPAWLAAGLLLLIVAGSIRSAGAWDDVQSGTTGDYQGWATVVRESDTYDGSTRIILEIDGERHEMWAFGRNGEARLRQWRAGDRIFVSGTREELRPERAGRVAWQHVVGRFEADWVADRHQGSVIERLSNWVRDAIEGAGSYLPADDGALFRGLLIGDDRDQPPRMLERFRGTGLAHLTAASGLNLVYVLALVGPLLRSMPPWIRWGVTCAVIGWYVVLTRFEPSIVRAGVMGVIAATAYVRGTPQHSLRTVSLAVIALVLIDPLLVWSVGFWMSVGGTTGIVLFARRFAARLRWLGPLALPVGVTIGAEIGVAPANILVFGRVSLVSIPANVLTGAPAGFVKLIGLPAGVVADAVPPVAGVVMLPLRFGVRWIDTVARVAYTVDPGTPGVAIAAGAGVLVTGAVWWRNRRIGEAPGRRLRPVSEDAGGGVSGQNERR